MEIELTKKTTCDNSTVFSCADTIREKIENEFNCKLMFTKLTDNTFSESNGSITISHTDGAHKIRLVFWEKNQNADKNHAEPRKKLAIIPSESELKKAI